MAKQPVRVFGVGGSNPGRLTIGAAAAAAAAKSQLTRVRTADQKTLIGCVTIRPAVMC